MIIKNLSDLREYFQPNGIILYKTKDSSLKQRKIMEINIRDINIKLSKDHLHILRGDVALFVLDTNNMELFIQNDIFDNWYPFIKENVDIDIFPFDFMGEVEYIKCDYFNDINGLGISGYRLCFYEDGMPIFSIIDDILYIKDSVVNIDNYLGIRERYEIRRIVNDSLGFNFRPYLVSS